METNTDRLLVRTRAVLDEWFVLVVVALLALSLVGGWGVFTALTAAPTADEGQSVETWSTTGGFEHSAVVQEENEVYDAETELTDRPTYFAIITPELEGEFQYAYQASSGDVTIDIELEHIIQAVDDDGDVRHWVVNETLETTSAQSVSPGEEQIGSFNVDVPAVANETEQIEESLGASPGTVESAIVAEVTMTGEINGDPVERTEIYELGIDPDGDVYHVDGPATERWTNTGEEAGEVDEATAGTSGFFGPMGSTLLLLTSLGALGAISLAKHRGTLSPSQNELEALRVGAEREEFDDWISQGRLPDDLRNQSQIEVETLEDLVDVAIDCDRRVIEDNETYYVVDSNLLYLYKSDPVSEITNSKSTEEVDNEVTATEDDGQGHDE